MSRPVSGFWKGSEMTRPVMATEYWVATSGMASSARIIRAAPADSPASSRHRAIIQRRLRSRKPRPADTASAASANQSGSGWTFTAISPSRNAAEKQASGRAWAWRSGNGSGRLMADQR